MKKFTQVLPYVVCTKVRRHVHKTITKRRYGQENPGRFVFGKPVLFTLSLGLTTRYSFCVLVWNFYQTSVTVSTKLWLRFEAQIRPTSMAINFFFITARAGRKVLLCVKLLFFFMGEYSSVWPEICHVFSQIQWRFLHGISGKNYFGRIFRKFCANQGYRLPKLVKFRPTFCNFYSGSVLRWKSSHKYFHMLFAPRWGGKSIKQSQNRDTGKKIQDVLFSENQFCSLSVWDLLHVTPWVFWSEIFTRRPLLCPLSFGWDLRPRFVPRVWQ